MSKKMKELSHQVRSLIPLLQKDLDWLNQHINEIKSDDILSLIKSLNDSLEIFQKITE